VRRLAKAGVDAGIDLDAVVASVLARRLRTASQRPVAVALSGGGDSLALLLAAQAWAKDARRPLLVLSVDHGLQPMSAAWADACAGTAARLGLGFRALRWQGAKPASGLPAAARAARHRLLADAAREAGARVILMGHTADDRLEARVMRADGATTPEPREWSPSPVWPQGRGLFLLRPLLGVRRAEIRQWLAGRGETWIDDPANEDLRSGRARARRDVADGRAAPPPSEGPADASALALAVTEDASGGLHLSRAALRAAPADVVARFVAAACLCAAGSDRPATGARARRLAARLAGAEPFTATLAGARIEADTAQVRFLREAGEMARGGLPPLDLDGGRTAVWDGRFEVTTTGPARIAPSSGSRKRLAEPDRRLLAALPTGARGVYPVQTGPDGAISLATARPLCRERLLAACGAVDKEPA